LLDDGVTHGDASTWLPRLPEGSVDLFFTSPPYADARSYSKTRFVQEEVGHAYASTTAIYANVGDDFKNQVLAQALERLNCTWTSPCVKGQ